MTLTQEQQELNSRAIAIVAQRPGITEERLAIALGMTPRLEGSGGKTKRNPVVRKLIQGLADAGDLIVHRARFASQKEPSKLYPAGWQLPQKRLFVPAADRARTECRTIRVPVTEIHNFIPEKPMTALDRHLEQWRDRNASKTTPGPTDRPEPIQSKPKSKPEPATPPSVSVQSTDVQKSDAQKPAQAPTNHHQDVLEAITALTSSDDVPSIKTICRHAGISTATLYEDAPLLEQVRGAIAAQRERIKGIQRQQISAALNELIEQGQPFTLAMLRSKAQVGADILRVHSDLLEQAEEAIARLKPCPNRDRLRALDRLLSEGAPFSLANLEREAGVGSGVLYKYADLLKEAKDAVARLKVDVEVASPSKIASKPSKRSPDKESHLKAEIERLNAEIQQLQQTITQMNHPTLDIAEVKTELQFIDRLREEEMLWRLKAEDFRREIQELQADLDAALLNAAACRHLLELHEQVESAAPVHTNGHSKQLVTP